MDCRSLCSLMSSSWRGLNFASNCADIFLSSSESSIACCTLTTATFNWADAELTNGEIARHSKPARMARERNIVVELLRMEKHRLSQSNTGVTSLELRPALDLLRARLS